MTFEAEFAALGLEDWQPALVCESRSHARGADGCEGGGVATHIVELLHPIGEKRGDMTHPNTAAPLQQLVCAGRLIWIRGRLSNHVHCEACGTRGTLADFVRIVGPIGEA